MKHRINLSFRLVAYASMLLVGALYCATGADFFAQEGRENWPRKSREKAVYSEQKAAPLIQLSPEEIDRIGNLKSSIDAFEPGAWMTELTPSSMAAIRAHNRRVGQYRAMPWYGRMARDWQEGIGRDTVNLGRSIGQGTANLGRRIGSNITSSMEGARTRLGELSSGTQDRWQSLRDSASNWERPSLESVRSQADAWRTSAQNYLDSIRENPPTLSMPSFEGVGNRFRDLSAGTRNRLGWLNPSDDDMSSEGQSDERSLQAV